MSTSAVLQSKLTAGLAVAGRQWMRLLEDALSDDAISGPCAVPLIMIGRSGGGIHQVTLAEQVGVVGPSLVRLLDQLCNAGLVRRVEDSNDRRAKKLWLTEDGALLASTLEARLTKLRSEVFGELTVDELRAALRVQQRLAQAVESLPHHGGKTRRSIA